MKRILPLFAFLLGCASSTGEILRPAALPATLESWYKIVHEGKHIGFVHERLERDAVTDVISYRRTERFTLKDQAFSRSLEVAIEPPFLVRNLPSGPLGLYVLRQSGSLRGEPLEWSGFGEPRRVTEVRWSDAQNDEDLVRAFVDRFGRIVEATMKSGARMVLVKNAAEAKGSLPTGRTSCWKSLDEPWWHCERR